MADCLIITDEDGVTRVFNPEVARAALAEFDAQTARITMADALATADAHAARINQCHTDLNTATWEETQAAKDPVVEETSD